MLLNTLFSASIQSGESNSFGNVPVPENVTHQTSSINNPIVDGTGNSKATKVVQLLLSVTTGGTTLDLTACGAKTGLDGANRDFSNGGSGGNIKAIIIENMDAANKITLSQGSNGWTGISGAATGLNKDINAGGSLSIHDPVGLPVTSTNKALTLTATTATVQVKITIVGNAA